MRNGVGSGDIICVIFQCVMKNILLIFPLYVFDVIVYKEGIVWIRGKIMNENNFKDIESNMGNAMIEFTKGISEISKKFNMVVSVEAIKIFVDVIHSIPDSVKDTEFFRKIQELKKRKNIRYEDIQWLLEEYNFEFSVGTTRDFIENLHENNDLHSYIKKIVLKRNMAEREKLIILLSHIEPLIYDTFNYQKQSRDSVKNKTYELAMENNEGMRKQNIGKIFVLGVAYIVFSNTDLYTDEIDKRIPFRNNILHNGITSYTDQEVKMAYGLLLEYIVILIQMKPLIADD